MEIKKIALNRAISILKAAGVKFAIVEQDGTKHGDLEVAEPKPVRRVLKYEHGLVRDHVRQHAGQLQPGEAAVIPLGDFDMQSIQSSVCSMAVSQWGNGSVLTHRNNVGVEVLRVS